MKDERYGEYEQVNGAVVNKLLDEVEAVAQQLNASNERNGRLRSAVKQAIELFGKYELENWEAPVPKCHKNFIKNMTDSLST